MKHTSSKFKRKIWNTCCWILLTGLFFACNNGDDDQGGEKTEEPIAFVLSLAEKIEDEDWIIQTDKRFALSVDDEVKEFSITQTGEISTAEPFYPNGRNTITVEAWFPYRAQKLQQPIVKAEQHVQKDYQASNLLEMLPVQITLPQVATRTETDKVKIHFVRRTAKLECVLKKGENAEASLNLETATVSLLNLTGVEGGTNVRMNSEHRAYVCPQTLKMGTEFIRIDWPDRDSYFYTLPADLTIKAGQPYTLTITITNSSGDLDLHISKSSDWDGSDEIITGSAPALSGEETNNEKWTGGDSTETSGGSSATDPSGTGTGKWTGGDSTETSGGTSTSNPSGTGAGNWAGSNTETSGGTSTSNPSGTGAENWTGNSEDVTGTKEQN